MFKVVVLRKCELVGHADGVMNLALVSDQRLNQLLEVGRVDSGGSTVASTREPGDQLPFQPLQCVISSAALGAQLSLLLQEGCQIPGPDDMTGKDQI